MRGDLPVGLFDAPRDHWYPALVVVDEAQVFAPGCRRRGQRRCPARFARRDDQPHVPRPQARAGRHHRHPAARQARQERRGRGVQLPDGRTFLDIDMARAADLLGMERRQAEAIRDLERGQFLALGPALSRRPVDVRIGPVRTGTRTSGPRLTPLPDSDSGAHDSVLRAAAEAPAAVPRPAPPPAAPADEVIRRLQPVAAPARLPIMC
jgi:hypothetical protein